MFHFVSFLIKFSSFDVLFAVWLNRIYNLYWNEQKKECLKKIFIQLLWLVFVVVPAYSAEKLDIVAKKM